MRTLLVPIAVMTLASCELLDSLATSAPDMDLGAAADTTSDVADEEATVDSGSDAAPFDVGPTPGISETVTISATTGGSVVLSDGTSLEVPGGALEADTEITVRRASSGPADGSPFAFVALEPSGLQFATAATLRVPIDTAAAPADSSLHVVMASSLHGEVTAGGEVDVFEPRAFTEAAGTVSLSIDHFSMLAIAYQPDFFVVPLIPAEYLRMGDILFTTTSAGQHIGGTLWPSHVALVANIDRHAPVIESTVAEPSCGTETGVQTSPYDEAQYGAVHLCGQHNFIGVRRPRAATEAQGEAAAWAAQSYVGRGYGIVGQSVGGMTCVQVTEQAWEEAGVNIAWTPDFMLTPFNQYENTEPVREITVDIRDGEIRVPVIAVVNEATDYYTALGGSRFDATVSLSVSPPGPQLDGRIVMEDVFAQNQAVNDVVMRLTEEDVGQTYEISVRVTAPELSFDQVITHFLTVNVEGPPPSEIGEGTPCYLGRDRYFKGSWIGSASPGGEFSFSEDAGPLVGARFSTDGTDFFFVQEGCIPFSEEFCSGGVIRLPSQPIGDSTYVRIHPRRFPEEPENWDLNCRVADGSIHAFSTFAEFDGTVTVTTNSDCTALTAQWDINAGAWLSDDIEDFHECEFHATFQGVLEPEEE